jgi:hypothetical protein
MLHRLPWALALALAIVLPLRAADPKPDVKNIKDTPRDEAKKDETKPEEKSEGLHPPALPHVSKDKWLPVGILFGELRRVNGGSMTVHVKWQELEQNPNFKPPANNNQAMHNFQRQMQNYHRQMSRMGHIRNPAQQMARMQQMQMQMMGAEMRAMMQQMQQQQKLLQQMYKVVTKEKDFDVALAEEVKVRLPQPPLEFDDKGNPKKHTADELKKMRGPGNFWGFPADTEALQPGQMVQVFMYRKAPQKTTAAAPTRSANPQKSAADKDSDTEITDAGADDPSSPLVKIVYIRQESNNAASAAKPKKGK